MSSRILTGVNAARAGSVQWRTASGEHAGEPAAREAPRDGEPVQESSETIRANHQIVALEERIRELEAELSQRQEKGRREGKVEGEKTGADTERAALRPLMDRLTLTIAEVASYRARFRRESESELLKLSVAVARKILRRELTVDPQSLLGILKGALETMNQAEVLSIRSSPSDASFLSGSLTSLGLPDRVEVIPDRTLESGSLILETKRGQIDASVQTQLIEIENGFADRIAGGKPK